MKQKTNFYTVSPILLNVVFAFIVCSCGGLFNSADMREQALADQQMQIEQRIYHYSSDSSLLLFNINTDDLLYARSSKENGFRAQLMVEIKLIDPDNRQTVYVDSLLYEDNQQSQDEDLLVGRIPIPIPSNKNLELRTRYTDINKKQEVILRGFTNKTGKAYADGVLLIMPNGLPLISRVNQSNGVFEVKGNTSRNSKLFYSNKDFGMAPPPFAKQVDFGNIVFEVRNLRDTLVLDSNRQGFYKIGTGIGSNDYFTFLHRPKGFPMPSDYRELILATGYFKTSEELNPYLKNINTREAFESFWLTLCGNKEKAKRSLQEYYERLSEANKFFTQYTDGWKTDRGMVYMILGPPARVFYEEKSEIWIYGRDSNVNTVSFTFEKKYSDQIGMYYELNRNGGYRQVWSIAVSTWRAGRIFRF